MNKLNSIKTFLLITFLSMILNTYADENYCATPPFLSAQAPPNVMIMLSIETPMQGTAHPSIKCSGDPSTTNYGCVPHPNYIYKNPKYNWIYIDKGYNNDRTYYGYFDPKKCYVYDSSAKIFIPDSYTPDHKCSGKWSGNLLNWATMMAVDTFRKIMTGGNRIIDTKSETVILAARQTIKPFDWNLWFPIKRVDNAGSYTPFGGTIYILRHSNGFVVCKDKNNDGVPDCYVKEKNSDPNPENWFPIAKKVCSEDVTSTCEYDSDCSGSCLEGFKKKYMLRIKVCDKSVGLESNCKLYEDGVYKPIGVLQKYAEKMRFSLISYVIKDNPDISRDGGVLRANMKWIAPKIKQGLKYHDSSGSLVTCSDIDGCDNPEKEFNEDGILINNPDNVSNGNSGIINYINKFGYKNGYKSYDPISEMYYEIIRYFKNLDPTDDYCKDLASMVDDGFVVYCDNSKSSKYGWRDPILYPCQKNFIVAVNDANPWMDKRIPGTKATDPCGKCKHKQNAPGECSNDKKCIDYSEPSDADSSINVSEWTDKVGDDEGLTPGDMCIGCVLSGSCDWNANNKHVTHLSEAFGTCYYPSKENSYYISGLAYYAHTTDIRDDLEGKQNIITYMIDTQETNSKMLVGNINMLYLAAKYGGFKDLNGNNKPDLKEEWDKNNDGFPDTYFFASDPADLEKYINKAFQDILKRVSSGTSVSILSNKRNKGAILSQAIFFPEKNFTDTDTDTTHTTTWIGNIYGYWFYIGRNTQNIREDSNKNLILDTTNEHDYILEFDIDSDNGNTMVHRYKSKSDGTKGSELSTSPVQIEKISHLFKAGDLLRDVSGSDRTIYIEKDGSLVPFVSSNVIDDLLYLLSDDCLTSKDQLVSYIRGESDHGCRSRKTDDDKIWKLGDIIYSTPKVVDYRDYSVMFVGANDGMLHAFKIGKIRKDGLSINQKAKLCKNLDDDDCPNYSSSDLKEIGKELWAFIPKNVMPYLKYLADPDYCHMYFVDLSPYIIEEDTNKDGIIDKRILIGGLRFGGAAGCHKESGDEQVWCSANQIVPEYEDCNPNDMSDCVGLSSYFALDITDPENPKFLWEFADPYLGFSFSGPAYLKRGDYRYVMFVSGPTNYKGEADGQDLNIFILGLENDFKFGGVLKIDGQGKEGFVKNSTLSEYNNAFGGRLFTEGIDGNGDGKTDIVFFGVSTKTDDGWKGNVLGVKLTNDDDPTQWKIVEVFNDLIKPVTAKIDYMRCFNMNYIYFGTGRWFYKTDEIGNGDSDKEKLYGIRIDGCLQNDDCSLDSVNSNSNNACQALQDGDLTTGWTIDQDLLPIGSGYFKERNITDPTPINSKNSNIIVFTTMQPSGDLCGFGGRTRLWALNCATGANINDNSCGGYVPKVPEGKLLLQLSLGNIEEQKLSEITSKHSDWFTGIPPESATPFASGSSPIGRILLWLEK
ncbi:pilus assembly protein [Persephonella sp.]